MKVSIILAVDENNGIGKDNGLPWPKMSADMKRFKSLTTGHYIIMGRNTYEALGGLLPNRKHIVVSRNTNYFVPPGVSVQPSLAMALKTAKDGGEEEVFIIGGAKLFKEAVLYADKFYLTRIHGSFEADTTLPAINMEEWNTIDEMNYERDDKNPYGYTFITLEKKKPEEPQAAKPA
jgi:dihydrofolate reductase